MADLAAKVRVSEATISRYENGKVTPPTDVIERLAKVLNADRALAEDLVSRARVLNTEFSTWRVVNRDSAAAGQRSYQELEAAATVVRTFQPALIPGLLQLPEYTRQMMARNVIGFEATPEAIAARMERQALLYDESKSFEFVITEWALCARLCHEQALRAQWDRLTVLAGLPNIDIRILPMHAELPVLCSTPIILLDEEVAIVETLTGEVRVLDPRDVADHRRTFDALQAKALTKGKTIAFLTRLLRPGAETDKDLIGREATEAARR